MPPELPPRPAHWQQWPCGPECRCARPVTGTYGEWVWCDHPQRGGRLVREGRDCLHYEAGDGAAERDPLHLHTD